MTFPRAARLIVADSESCADLYWATRFFVPDPIIYIEHRGKKILVASDLEFSRAKKEAAVDLVLPTSRYKGKKDLIDSVLRERKIKRLLVPSYFPLATADRLRKKGYRLQTVPDPFYPARAIKGVKEKKALVESLRATERAIGCAIETLKESKIKRGKIYSKGSLLTSESLRRIIETDLMGHGFVARHTTVACGRQSADPHCVGSGPLYANQPIVIDVFPRSSAAGYHGDITRTVLKGHASETLRKMYRAVRTAQENGIRAIRHGIDGAKVHRIVQETLDRAGFKTGSKNGRPEGFIHGTGHGLGLEIHEPPRVGRVKDLLKKGNVVTVEPGLYYSDLGGIRIEDVVSVTRRGCELLTRLPKIFEIR